MAQYDMMTYWGDTGKLFCGKHRTSEFHIYWKDSQFVFVCALCDVKVKQPQQAGSE